MFSSRLHALTTTLLWLEQSGCIASEVTLQTTIAMKASYTIAAVLSLALVRQHNVVYRLSYIRNITEYV